MNNHANAAVDIDALQKLYQDDETLRIMLDHFASRKRNRTEVKVERLIAIFADQIRPLSGGEIIDGLRQLESVKCGSFIVGRPSRLSRFRWAASMTSVGRAAAGDLQNVETSLNDGDDDEEDGTEHVLDHRFRLRPDLTVMLTLPSDLSPKEAGRLGDFIKALPFE